MPSIVMAGSSHSGCRIASTKLQGDERAEQRGGVGRMRVIVRKSRVAAAPGVSETVHANEARDDATVDAIVVGDHRASVSERSLETLIGGGQSFGGLRRRRQADANEVSAHE